MKLQARVVAILPLVLLAVLLFIDRNRRQATPTMPRRVATTVDMAHAQSAGEMTRTWAFPGAKPLMTGVTSPMAVIRTDTTPRSFEEVRSYYVHKAGPARPETSGAGSPAAMKAATFDVRDDGGAVVIHVTRSAGDKTTKITLTSIPK